MQLYETLVRTYHSFLLIFPPSVQWIVTLVLVIAIVGAFVSLIRHNILFVFVAVLFIPVVAPILGQFLGDIYTFLLYLLHQLGVLAPK